jgi:hypothetical protein
MNFLKSRYFFFQGVRRFGFSGGIRLVIIRLEAGRFPRAVAFACPLLIPVSL